MPFVLVCPLTTARRGISLHIELDADQTTGLDHPSYVQCELLRSISRRRLVHRIGVVDLDARAAVHDMLRVLLGH